MSDRMHTFRTTITFNERIHENWLWLEGEPPPGGFTVEEIRDKVFSRGYTVRDFFRAYVVRGTPLDIKVTIIDEANGQAVDAETGEEVTL